MNINKLDSEQIKKKKKIQLETIKESKKPDNIIEKILDGKMKKFYSDSTLMNQHFIMDPDKTISEILKEFSARNKFSISAYELVVLGH